MRILSILAMVFLFHRFVNAQEQKILFLGNSYTYVNDLPQTLKDLAQSMGKSVFTDQNTPGGYRLLDHASNTTSMDKIFTNQWDFVVLQAQSQEPSWPLSQLEAEVFPYAKQLSDSIKKNRVCTEVLFFSTWGRQNGDGVNCASWPPVCTFEGMNDRLTVAYSTMAEQNNAAIAPVGQAWKTVREDGLYNSINLYSSDGSHPSVYGTYLTACVFYNSIYKEPVENANYYSSLSQEEAEYLQSVANSIFDLSYQYLLSDTITNADYTFTRNSWYENGVLTVSDFSFFQTGLELSFTNLSLNANSYLWNFGDGNESDLFEPIYTYPTSGAYDVRLVSFGQCSNDTVVKTMDFLTNIHQVNNASWPQIWVKNKHLFFGNLEDVIAIDIFGIDGKLLKCFLINDKSKISYLLNYEYSVLLVRMLNTKGQFHTQKIVL